MVDRFWKVSWTDSAVVLQPSVLVFWNYLIYAGGMLTHMEFERGCWTLHADYRNWKLEVDSWLCHPDMLSVVVFDASKIIRQGNHVRDVHYH